MQILSGFMHVTTTIFSGPNILTFVGVEPSKIFSCICKPEGMPMAYPQAHKWGLKFFDTIPSIVITIKMTIFVEHY